MTESNSDGCTEGTARLANSTIKNEGRIEVCRQGTWGPVCGVGVVEAYVACRELGFDAGMAILILPVYTVCLLTVSCVFVLCYLQLHNNITLTQSMVMALDHSPIALLNAMGGRRPYLIALWGVAYLALGLRLQQ